MIYNHNAWLLVRYQRNELSPGEQLEFDNWLDEAPANRERLQLYNDPEWQIKELADFSAVDLVAARRKIARKIRRQRQRKIIVPAGLTIIILIAGTLLLMTPKEDKTVSDNLTEKENTSTSEFKMDSGKIYLTFEEDTTIQVQDAKDGLIAEKGNLQLMKKGKQYIFKGIGSNQPVSFNTFKLVTSWGVQCQVQLPDSSQIRLNALSSVRYPAGAGMPTRSIRLEGEGYCDIKRDESSTFSLMVANMEVQVLGTKFNINAYPNEGQIKASLIDGKIKIVRGAEQKTLKAGQSASVWPSKPIEVLADSGVDESIAWTDEEYFLFDEEKISSIMKQLERWYNVNIILTHTSKEPFTGRIKRNQTIEEAIDVIFDGKMQIEKKNREITLVPKQSKKH